MKISKKIIAAALLVASALWTFSCKSDTPEEPSTPQDQQITQDAAGITEALAFLAKKMKKDVANTAAKIELPTKHKGVAIAWKSDKPNVISADGTVRIPEGDGTEKVTLTATLTKGKATPQKKDFPINVQKKPAGGGTNTPNTPELPPDTDAADITEALAFLAKEMKKDIANTAAKITLPKERNGVAIAWESDKPHIIGTDGSVQIPEGDGTEKVTLTATLTKGKATPQKKDFPINVQKKPAGGGTGPEDEQTKKDANAIKAAVKFLQQKIPEQVLNTETKIELPTEHEGVAIAWKSDKPDVIRTDGAVRIPEGSGTEKVTLSATLTKGKAQAQENTFEVAVQRKAADGGATPKPNDPEKPNDPSNPENPENKPEEDPAKQDAEAIKAAIETLQHAIPQILEKTATKIELPKDLKGVGIAWKSSKPNVIGEDGAVTIPEGSGMEEVTLTATLTKGKATPVTKDFKVSVQRKSNAANPHEEQAKQDAAAITAAIAYLQQQKIPKTLAKTATKIELPKEYNGVSIAWKSSNPNVIGAGGSVRIPEGSGTEKVTLTATLTKGKAMPKTQEFSIDVQRNNDNFLAVAAAKAKLNIPSELLNAIQKIALPTEIEGVSITWKSSKPDVIGTDGTVKAPDGKGVTPVELTATLKKGAIASDTAKFTVKVHHKDKEATADEVLNAITLPPLTIDKNELKPQTLPLTKTIAGEKTIDIAYTTSDAKHLALNAENNKVTVRRDIIDIAATLTAELSCEGKTRKIQLPLQIPHIPKLEKKTKDSNGQSRPDFITSLLFDGQTLEITWKGANTAETGWQYAYTANAAKGEATLSAMRTYTDGRWQTKDEYVAEKVKKHSVRIRLLKTLYNTPSFENLKALFNTVFRADNPFDDEGLIKFIVGNEDIRKHFPSVTDPDEAAAVAQFKQLSDAEKAAGHKALCADIIKDEAAKDGLPDGLSPEESLTRMEALKSSEIRQVADYLFFKDIQFAYAITPASGTTYDAYLNELWITLDAQYNAAKEWHAQYVKWEKLEPGDDGYWRLRLDDAQYKGTFNAPYTELSYTKKIDADGKESDETGKWSISQNKGSAPPSITAKNSKSGETITLKSLPKSILQRES